MLEVDDVAHLQFMAKNKQMYLSQDQLDQDHMSVRVLNTLILEDSLWNECKSFVDKYNQESRDLHSLITLLKEEKDNVYAEYINECMLYYLNRELKHSVAGLNGLSIEDFCVDFQELEDFVSKSDLVSKEAFARICSKLETLVQDLKVSIDSKTEHCFAIYFPVNIDIHFIKGFNKVDVNGNHCLLKDKIENILDKNQLDLLYRNGSLVVGFHCHNDSISNYRVRRIYSTQNGSSITFANVL